MALTDYVIMPGADYQDACDAIREKTGKTDAIVSGDMGEEIRNIETGIDTSDATAAASDIASGKTAYVNGEKVTGNVQDISTGVYLGSGIAPEYTKFSSGTVQGAVRFNSNKLMRTGSKVQFDVPLSPFGAVTADKVLSGETFTSEAGLNVPGTMPNNGAISQTMDGVDVKSVEVPAGFTSGGTVSMDSTVDDAVSDALTALTDKGVTVPEGANVKSLAGLIGAIEAGGDKISELFGADVQTGTYIPAEDTTSRVTIEFSPHFELEPNLVFIIEDLKGAGGFDRLVYMVFTKTKSGDYGNGAYIGTGAKASLISENKYSISTYMYGGTDSINTGSFIIPCSTTMILKAGRPYMWFAVG